MTRKEAIKLVKKRNGTTIASFAKESESQIWLNGTQTIDYTEKQEGIAENGLLGLQIHSGPPSEAWFKDITIKVLP